MSDIIIVNDKENVVLNFEHISEINIHSDRCRIMARMDNAMAKDIVLGTYDNANKCKRAFALLATRLAEGESCQVEDNDSSELNTHLQGDYTQRKQHTNGKTK